MSGIETTVIISAVVLWFAIGWYLNERLRYVHEKLDRTLAELEGLREYLYELDPQFDDERALLADLHDGAGKTFAGMEHMELIKRKEAEGTRTLTTPFAQT